MGCCGYQGECDAFEIAAIELLVGNEVSFATINCMASTFARELIYLSGNPTKYSLMKDRLNIESFHNQEEFLQYLVQRLGQQEENFQIQSYNYQQEQSNGQQYPSQQSVIKIDRYQAIFMVQYFETFYCQECEFSQCSVKEQLLFQYLITQDTFLQDVIESLFLQFVQKKQCKCGNVITAEFKLLNAPKLLLLNIVRQKGITFDLLMSESIIFNNEKYKVCGIIAEGHDGILEVVRSDFCEYQGEAQTILFQKDQ